MKTVHEVARLSGVSVRALHHYDAIGLLKPAQVTEAGYRLYDENTLLRLQRILLLRELRFSLKEIREILDTPGYDPDAALCQQIRLLEMQREHLDKLIRHARQIQKTGGYCMDFSPFNTEEWDAYAAQAKAMWGKTDAYREYEKKAKGRTKAQSDAVNGQVMDFFVRLGKLRGQSPDSEEAQNWVRDLQEFFTANFYTCTPEILMSLGEMYDGGGSMTENINAAGGEGTGKLAREAIVCYCRK